MYAIGYIIGIFLFLCPIIFVALVFAKFKSARFKKMIGKKVLVVFGVLSVVSIAIRACSAGDEDVSKAKNYEPGAAYENAADFEAALNGGADVVGSTVVIDTSKIVPDSVFGFNIQAGEHLNFCTEKNPGIKEGSIVKVKVTEVNEFMGSHIIGYDLMDVVKLPDYAGEELESVEQEDAEKKEEQEPAFDPSEQTDDLAAMFMYIGFTKDEAAEMEEIFDTLGIHEGRNIRLLIGSGIDELQSFAFDPYNSKNLQVNCTVENRELCLVWLAGIPGYKPVFKIGFFGKPKIVEERTTESVDMFNRWVDDTDYHRPIEDSYLVTIDWEEMKLSEYKEGTLE